MEPTLPFVKSHAFIIGINDYVHLPPLKTAVNDAKGIAERLEVQHGYEIHGPLLNATKEELHTLFTETIPKTIGPEDRIIFYFAGHGIAIDGEDGPNGYIVPADAVQRDEASLIPMDMLHKALLDAPCKHGLLILDCCFSGAFKWSTGYRDVVFDLPKVIYEERFWRYVKDSAWQVITSSAHDQKAVDVVSNQSIGMREEGEMMHSPFAMALFEGIDGAGDVIPADQGDGVITASELYAYLRDYVEGLVSQSPSMFNLSKHDKGEFIFLNPRHRLNLPPTPDRNPFMGLLSYNEKDSHFFFGRDRVTEALVEKVQKNALTVVSGASGTGKSSVIKAGLLPILRKKGWELLPVIRPGKEPIQILNEVFPDLKALLSSKSPEPKLLSIQKELDALMEDSNTSHLPKNADKKYLLIIDQYEELISQCLKEEDRIAFEKQLAEWLKTYPQLHIILSVRSDFEPQFESEALSPWWKKGRYIVPSFSQQEIREVITKPALQAILFYEPLELVDRLEEEVAQAPGVLPLLSFTLSELYYAYLKSGRQDRSLTLEDYESMGGVIGALRSKADEVYLEKDDLHRSSMRKVMLRMVSLEGGELAGKRVYVDELIFTDTGETQRIKTVANKLVDARLILRGKDQQDRIYLEPAHDALVRAWARLWDWIKDVGEEKLVWQNKLSQAVEEYHELANQEPKKSKKLLWNNNPRLDILNAELKSSDHAFNKKEAAFVMASAKRRSNRKNLLVWSLLGVIAIVTGLAFWANIERKEAIEQTRIANFESTKSNSWYQASEATNKLQNEYFTEALSTAWQSYTTQANENTSKALVAVSEKKPQDLFRHKIIQHGLSDPVGHVEFSHNGRYMFVADAETTDDIDSIAVWQWSPLKFLFKKSLDFLEGEQSEIGFSHHGEWLMAFNYEEKVKKAWKLPTGDSISLKDWPFNSLLALLGADDVYKDGEDYKLLFQSSSKDYVVFSLDNLRAGGQNDQSTLTELFDKNAPWIEHHIKLEHEPEKAFFSSNGQAILSSETTNGYEIYKHRLIDNQEIAKSGLHELSIEYIVSPENKNYILAMHNSGVVYAWDSSLTTCIDSLSTYYGDFMHPSGRFVLGGETGENKRNLNIWEIRPEIHFEPLVHANFSHKGDRRFGHWTKLSPGENYFAYNLNDSIWIKALSPQENPRFISQLGKYEAAHFDFSSDEKYLLERKTTNSKIKLAVYEVESGKILYRLDTSLAAVFSADGKNLITSEKDSSLYVRDIKTAKIIKPLNKLGDNFGGLRISSKGKYIAAWGPKTIIIDTQTGKIRKLARNYDYLEFSRDESLILGNGHFDIDVLEASNTEVIRNFGSNSQAAKKPFPVNFMELQMLTIENNRYLVTGSGVFDIETGFQVESFLVPYGKKNEPHSSHIAIDPKGKFQLRRYSGAIIKKAPIMTRDWLENKIYKYPDIQNIEIVHKNSPTLHG